MGRNPTGSDVKMLKAGAALAKAKGLNGFTVRQVCAKSKVNLGMFHYYFSTKENFDMAVLESIYSKMIENIKIKVSPSASPKQNVRAILINIQEFIKENRVLLSSLGGGCLFRKQKNFQIYSEELYQARGNSVRGASAGSKVRGSCGAKRIGRILDYYAAGSRTANTFGACVQA